FLRSKKTQSPLLFSRRVRFPRAVRLCRSRTSASGRPRNFAMVSSSLSLTQTYPGAPVQQSPHCVQVNCNPSAYHGALSVFASSFTSGSGSNVRDVDDITGSDSYQSTYTITLRLLSCGHGAFLY